MKTRMFLHTVACALLVMMIGCTPVPALQEEPIVSAESTSSPASNTWTDDFNGALTSGWSWIDEDPTHWNLSTTPGALRIVTQGESLYNADQPQNLLWREAPTGDFEVMTKVTFDPQSNFQQAAILIFQDNDNFVLLNRGFCDVCLDTGSGIFIDNEMNGKLDTESSLQTEISLQTTWLKLRKEGTIYTGFYSSDGQNWNELGRVENPMPPTKVGLTANNSNDEPSVPQIPADYDFFTIAPTTLTSNSSQAATTSIPSEATPTQAITPLLDDQIVATIPVGQIPFRLEVGESGVWVTDQKDSAVYRIDPETNQIIAAIPVGKVPKGLSVSEGSVWVANTGGSTVSRIDTQTNQVVATIEVGASPRNVAAGVNAIWVTSGKNNGIVSRIDPVTNQVVTTIEVEPVPSQIAVENDAVWVASLGSHIVSRIDPQTNQVVAKIDVGQSTVALVAGQGAVWAAGDEPTLVRIDPETNQVMARIAVGTHSWEIAADIDTIWVTSNKSDTLWRIDPHTNQVVSTYKVGDGPLGVAVGEGSLWVVNSFEPSVWRIKP